MKRTGDFTGAFADGAVLFPLLMALTLQTGMDGGILLASAGAAYIAAGLVFRVPMAVQPLKSVVVAALALGAGAGEIAISGFTVGVVCLFLSFCHADKLAALVPRHLVHGLQMALGLMLITKGSQWGLEQQTLVMAGGFLLLSASIFYFSWRTDKPVMGWIASAGLLAGLFFAVTRTPVPAESMMAAHLVRVDVILALVLPQMALTLTNSVIGTHDVAQRYFGAAAARVTPKRLLRSIGIGNIIAAPLGGLPYCHGAGGITAHIRGGAQSWRMNFVIGAVLLGLALVSWMLEIPVIPACPKILMAALLVATGWFHMMLVGPSWKQADLRPGLIVMGVTAILSQNMLIVLAAGIACEMIRVILRMQMTKAVKK